MERDNFDTYVITQLEGRTIVPSDEAWKKLEAKLTPRHQARKSPIKTYYKIAASLVILLTVGGYFLKTVTTEKHHPVVEYNKSPQVIFPQEQQATVKEYSPFLLQKEQVEKESRIKRENNRIQDALVLHKPTEMSENTMAEKTRKAQHAANTVALIETPQDKSARAVREAHTLLEEARAALATTPMQTATSDKVDPMVLLIDVEEALDRQFKDKVFEALKTNFYKLKTAVAERND